MSFVSNTDWQNDKQQVRVIKELKLYEGSAVLWGANPETPTLAFKGEMQPQDKKTELSNRLEKLLKAFKGGRFTDETFSLMEIEIKRIQADLLEIEVIKEFTQPAEAVEPIIEEMIEGHDLQWFEVLSLVHGYLMSHYPDAKEIYEEDGTSPAFYYGPASGLYK